MDNSLFIPKKIKVGFNYREDTYSGKLAFAIYYDSKGVLRQKNSWEGWIQKPGDNKNKYYYNRNGETVNEDDLLGEDYAPQDFENVPLSGFILNRNVGGARQSYGYNARVEKVRVYDPRGFEFEIDLNNLLFILQECTSTKGKGLEGEFVYSWNGKNIFLLPTDSLEYKESILFTERQGKKVTKKDMLEGCHYTFKSGEKVIYLGRHESYNLESYYNMYSDSNYNKYHIFKNLDSDDYILEKGFTKLAIRNTEEADMNYAEYLEEFLKSPYHSKFKKITYIPQRIAELNDEFLTKKSDINSLCTNYFYTRGSSITQFLYENTLYDVNITYVEKEDKYLLSLENARIFDVDKNVVGERSSRYGVMLALSKDLIPTSIKEAGYRYLRVNSDLYDRQSVLKCLFTFDEISTLDTFGKSEVELESGLKIDVDTYLKM